MNEENKELDLFYDDLNEFENEEANNEDAKMQKPILTETELIKRKKRKVKTVITAFVLVLAIGVAGNWYYQNTDVSNTVEPLISASNKKTLGEAELVDAQTTAPKENEYFASARVDRQNARDEALDKLQKIVDNTDESEQAKKVASEEIAKISNYITIENKIETLVTAKGVNNCLAVINKDGTRVDVIVDVEDLNETVVLQIKEIATSQLNCSFENVSIIQSK